MFFINLEAISCASQHKINASSSLINSELSSLFVIRMVGF